MDLFASVALGAGMAGFVYSKMGRRIGYGNAQNVWTTVGITFIISAVIFFTVLKTLGL